MQPTVSLKPGVATDVIHYTTDGTMPTASSPVYTRPLVPDKTSVVQAVSVPQGGLTGGIAKETITRYEWQKAVAAGSVLPGLSYKYFEPTGNVNMKSIENTAVAKEGIADVFSVVLKQRKEKFAFVFDGFVKIDKDGFYTFSIGSDDGSKLLIDGLEVANNDNSYGGPGKAALKKGYHKITVQYYDSGGENSLHVFVQPEGGAQLEIPAAMLFHTK